MADTEENFLAKVSPILLGKTYLIPSPTLPPLERLRRRLTFRNQLYLYGRKSAFSDQPMISMFPPTVKFPVVTSEEWFGDTWSGLSFGRDFDFSLPFFEQFVQLRDVVPHMGRSALYNNNCDYSNNLANSNNCYLVFNSTYADDCMYGENLWRSRDCIDCSYVSDCELCYDCTQCERCYNTQSSCNSEGCSDSFYLLSCRSCRNCFGCVNLRNAEFCVFNKQLSKLEYQQYIASLDLTNRLERNRLKEEIVTFWKQHPQPHLMNQHSENVTGNYIFHSNDIENGFFIRDGESLVNCSFLYGGIRDCRDFTFVGLNSELMYECAWCGLNCVLCRFCMWCLKSEDLLYCWHCVGCKHCFGCAGLQNEEYCIYNIKYSKLEYEKLLGQIIEHMTITGEWGQFFPISLSPIPYNHSFAERFFPLDENEVENIGGHWFEKSAPEAKNILDTCPVEIPDSDEPFVIRSEESGIPFRITSEEIRICRNRSYPLPTTAYDERIHARAQQLGGIRLYAVRCADTGAEIITNITPESGFSIWNREHYEKTFN